MILLRVSKAAAQTISIKCVGGKSPIVPGVCYSAGAGETLVVIKKNPVIANVVKFIGIEQELRGTNVHTSRVFVTDIQIAGKTVVLIIGSKFPAVTFAFAIVKG